MKLSELHTRSGALLTEGDYLMFREPVVVGDIHFDMLDCKFEFYNNHFIQMKWKGKLPNGRWLTYDRKVHETDPDPSGETLVRLPDGDDQHYWWKWAICIHKNQTTKPVENQPIPPSERDNFWGTFYAQHPDQGIAALLMRPESGAKTKFTARKSFAMK
jgi:hypothetical protein